MTKEQALKLALEALERVSTVDDECDIFAAPLSNAVVEALTAIKEALAQPKQEPVAMKFKIYKPTVPDPVRQGINNALLPWVYDQDRSSGFDASMWVTPVATLPPQRKPLTEQEIWDAVQHGVVGSIGFVSKAVAVARAIEAAHGIKE